MNSKNAIRLLKNLKDDIANHSNASLWHYEEELLEVIKMLESGRMTWIPIDKENWPDKKEELPGNFVSVLVSVGDDVSEAYRANDYWSVEEWPEDETFIPIHHADAWMLMPKSYKGEA